MINEISKPKISSLNSAEYNKTNKSFKGPVELGLSGLRALNSSPAVGACAVDLCSMVIPRTAIETKNRGKQSGFETFFREISSTLIHACVGLIGLGAATLMSGKFNNDYGMKAQNVFASGKTINNMSALWQNAEGNSGRFFDGFLSNLQGLNGTTWQGVSADAKGDIVQNLVELSGKAKELASSQGAAKKTLGKEVKELKNLVVAKITQNTGAGASFKLNAQEGTKELSASLSDLVDNAVSLSNSFEGKTGSAFTTFVDALKKNKTASTLLGLGICAALCMSIQPINKWLTKKRTGNEGFVGVEENSKSDKSPKFKALKTALGVGFPLFAIRTIGKPTDLMANVQFNSRVPTLNQFKLIYGLTIGSRFMSARDGNELREGVIKDSLGFTNWLIFGGMVSKLFARGVGGKELINNPVAQDGSKKGLKYAVQWLSKASVKSFDEVLLPAAQDITKDGKLANFREIFKNADGATKSKIYKIAGSQIAGYLYSGIVLGYGISKLNIFITKQVQARRKAGNQMNEKMKEPVQNLNFDVNFLTKQDSDTPAVFKDFN